MRGKKGNSNKGKLLLVVFAILMMVVMISAFAKGSQQKVVSYTYDTGNTLWDMAEKHCPDNMDVRDFVREIKKANEMTNSVVYENRLYKIPVYETESDYLDLATVIGYEVSDDGVLLLTNDGNGYFIEK